MIHEVTICLFPLCLFALLLLPVYPKAVYLTVVVVGATCVFGCLVWLGVANINSVKIEETVTLSTGERATLTYKPEQVSLGILLEATVSLKKMEKKP